MEDEYKVVCALLNSATFNDLQWPQTPVSRSQYSSEANMSQMVHLIHNLYEMWVHPYRNCHCNYFCVVLSRRSFHITLDWLFLLWCRNKCCRLKTACLRTWRQLNANMRYVLCFSRFLRMWVVYIWTCLDSGATAQCELYKLRRLEISLLTYFLTYKSK